MRRIQQIIPMHEGERGALIDGTFIKGMALIEEEDGSTSLEWITVDSRSRDISVTSGYFHGIDE